MFAFKMMVSGILILGKINHDFLEIGKNRKNKTGREIVIFFRKEELWL
jgi:hypothetical protein